MKAILFIDGDNIPAYYYEQMEKAIKYHFSHITEITQNLFINFKSPYFQQWYAKLSTYQTINLQVHHPYKGYTKNSIDIKIAIEVMKIINTFDIIIIASDDSDFSHLATTIRSYNVYAIGIGTQLNTNYSRYWNQFLQLEAYPHRCDSLKSLISIAQQSQYISAKESLRLLNRTFKSPTVFQCKSWKQVCKQYADLFEYKQGIILLKRNTNTLYEISNQQPLAQKQSIYANMLKKHTKHKKWFSIGQHTLFMIQYSQISAQEIFCFSAKNINYYQNLIA